jgi:hypothetical protein
LPKIKGLAETYSMAEQPTCGKGLASHSVLPAKLGELIASLAENLELHMKALDSKNQNAKKELDAYMKLAKEHREIAALLTATANAMAGYRELPMADHDAKVVSDQKGYQGLRKIRQASSNRGTLGPAPEAHGARS